MDFRLRCSSSGGAKIGGIQYTVLIAVAIFVIGSFVLTRTVTGLRIYAIGGDARAAELCGVPVGRTVVGLYTVNGLLIGVVAVLIAGRLGSITPTIASVSNWTCSPPRSSAASLFRRGRPAARHRHRRCHHRILNAGLIFVGLQSWWQSISVGAMLLLALVADQRRSPCAAGAPATPRPRSRSPTPVVRSARACLADGRCRRRRLTLRPRAGLLDHRREEVVRRALSLEEGTFTVAKGEVSVSSATNGAGKSTLVKIISGAIRPDAAR